MAKANRSQKMEGKMKSYKNLIGDGKLPNKYWVFQYDQKYKRVKLEDGSISIDIIKEDTETKDSLIGEFKTYEEALKAVDKAYLPNVVIEDRLSGQVFESMCIQCQECGKEEYESNSDIGYTKKEMAKRGVEFK
jgi:hypothetical protein